MHFRQIWGVFEILLWYLVFTFTFIVKCLVFVFVRDLREHFVLSILNLFRVTWLQYDPDLLVKLQGLVRLSKNQDIFTCKHACQEKWTQSTMPSQTLIVYEFQFSSVVYQKTNIYSSVEIKDDLVKNTLLCH